MKTFSDIDLPKTIATGAAAYSVLISLLNIAFFSRIGMEYIYFFSAQDLLFSNVVIFKLISSVLLLTSVFSLLGFFFWLEVKFIDFVRDRVSVPRIIYSNPVAKSTAFILEWTLFPVFEAAEYLYKSGWWLSVLVFMALILSHFVPDEWVMLNIMLTSALPVWAIYYLASLWFNSIEIRKIIIVMNVAAIPIGFGSIGNAWADGIKAGGEPVRYMRDDAGLCKARAIVRSNSTGVLLYNTKNKTAEFRTWRTIVSINDRPCWMDIRAERIEI